MAFFEAFGSVGLAALERLRADVPAEHVVILDAKRGDVGSTAERHAAALLGHLAADGVTLTPYLGEDAIEPFLAYPDRIVYVLARTSNASAPTLQHLAVDGGQRTLAEHVAAWVTPALAAARGRAGGWCHRPGRAGRIEDRCCPIPRSWFPASGPRAGTWRPPCAPAAGAAPRAW